MPISQKTLLAVFAEIMLLQQATTTIKLRCDHTIRNSKTTPLADTLMREITLLSSLTDDAAIRAKLEMFSDEGFGKDDNPLPDA